MSQTSNHMQAYCYMKRKTPTTSLPLRQRRKITETANMPPAIDPALSGGDGDDTNRDALMDTKDRTQVDDELLNMDVEQRKEVWKRTFSRFAEPLSCLAGPDECNTYPQYQPEIIAAYLQYTTFTVEIWANYDSATKKFYIDQRVNDCGLLKQSLKDHIMELDPNEELELRRVRLEIGSPFASLCTISIRVVPSKLDVGATLQARILHVDPENPRLTKFVEGVCAEIDGIALPYDQFGMRLVDIEHIASMFRRYPTHDEARVKKWNTNMGPWMDFTDESEKNTGCVDFEALGKGCGRCRGGCRYDHVMTG